MKHKSLCLAFLLLILLLTACNPFSKTEMEYPYSNVEIKYEVDEIKISNFKDFGHLNEEYHLVFEEKEQIKTFVNAIENARPVEGSIDMPEGDYNLLLYSNENISEGFHLWISERHPTGTIVNIADTATAYSLTNSSRNEILSLLSE